MSSILYMHEYWRYIRKYWAQFLQYLCRPNTVTYFAHFLLAAYVSCSPSRWDKLLRDLFCDAGTISRKSSSLPLVLITPLDAANGLSVVVGVPPVEDKNRKNFMGKVTDTTLKEKKKMLEWIFSGVPTGSDKHEQPLLAGQLGLQHHPDQDWGQDKVHWWINCHHVPIRMTLCLG